MTDDDLRDDFGDDLVEALRVRSRAATDEPGVEVVVHRGERRFRARHALATVLGAAVAVTGIAIFATRRQTPVAIHVAKKPPSDTTTTTAQPHGFAPLTTRVADWT